MMQTLAQSPVNFSVERGGATYPATYSVNSGRVLVIYEPQYSKRLEKSAPVGLDAETTARMLLRELIAESSQRRI
jgi:hypothetical protein